ncbi:MAG: FKBP-type peptidyl-prolyl cis-trans isomerase [Bacteroidetes bacterium]|nr:FKBP-type peptidyl-prolyl cis-trans isomerase [Bacteroidota bacterium]
MRFLPFIVCFISVLVISCNGNPNQKKQPIITDIDEHKIKNQFVEANKQLLKKENDEIDYYVKTHHQNFIKTQSGIRYFVLHTSKQGDSIKVNTKVTLNYTLSLLTGDVCYKSETNNPKQITVGNDDVESGLHRGLQYLKKGDKAVLILPSNLAHGLLGDFKKIPPQMPIIYEIEILP